MAEDTTPSSSVLSTPQATANLDDVLASLEKQMPAPEAVPAMQAAPAITEPVAQQIEAVTTPEPVIQTPATPEPIAPITPFQIKEAPIQSGTAVSAPVAEALPTPDHVQDHPAMEVSAPALEVPPVSETAAPSQPAAKPGLFGRFSFNPKFAIGALVVAFIAIGSVGAYVASQTPKGEVNTSPKAFQDCTIVYNGTSSFKVTGCGGGVITKFTGPSCPTTQTKVSEETIADEGTHEYIPNPQPGQCEQIDHNFSGIGTNGTSGGVCSCAPAAKKTCGGTCSSDSDCKNPSANGAAVACISGTCQNTACPGHTNTGANCDCNVALRQCGQTCSGALGLCAAGQGTCTYVNVTAPICPWSGATTYCAGTLNGYSRMSCTSGDTGGGYLKGPSGKTSGFTLAEIAASCTTVASTPTPTPVVTPTPTPTPTVAPTPTPTPPPLVCLNITKDVDVPVIGSQVRFTCGTVSGATSYEFRYKYTVTGAAAVEGSIGANQNVSDPLVVSTAAAYRVQCRPCVGLACTEWEAW